MSRYAFPALISLCINIHIAIVFGYLFAIGFKNVSGPSIDNSDSAEEPNCYIIYMIRDHRKIGTTDPSQHCLFIEHVSRRTRQDNVIGKNTF